MLCPPRVTIVAAPPLRWNVHVDIQRSVDIVVWPLLYENQIQTVLFVMPVGDCSDNLHDHSHVVADPILGDVVHCHPS
ncbi:hypothetical protein [uncultured Duncaniella sp.]|uniref:hypothetical protein n=1 Tax=uncultured Duncaniella sp. TaxID=2768039 RepID=UPI00262A13D6|nr:hypothetical protein [uncultured Duncaniella sp.]